MKILIILVSLFMISGCASVQYNRLAKNELPKLDPSGSAYVLTPNNATYYGKECIGSGQAMVNIICFAFSDYLRRVEIKQGGESLEEDFQKAKASDFTYLVDSKISCWEDYATEWNGRLDRFEMQMDIFDVKTSKLLDSVNFKGNGTWFTFGGYHPQNIVRKSIDDYTTSLFSQNMSAERK